MEVDDSAIRVDASSDVAQPTRRARRTYGKAKPGPSNEEEKQSSSLPLSHQIEAHTGPSTAGISSLRLGDWKNKLAELDKSSDEEEEEQIRSKPSSKLSFTCTLRQSEDAVLASNIRSNADRHIALSFSLVLHGIKESGAESSLPSPTAASNSQHSQAHSTSTSRSGEFPLSTRRSVIVSYMVYMCCSTSNKRRRTSIQRKYLELFGDDRCCIVPANSAAQRPVDRVKSCAHNLETSCTAGPCRQLYVR